MTTTVCAQLTRANRCETQSLLQELLRSHVVQHKEVLTYVECTMSVLERLQALKRTNERDPDSILSLGMSALSFRGLGDEKWNVVEQVLLAALDVPDLKLANAKLEELKKRFPQSARVMKLQGLVQEAEGKYKDAAATYKSLEGKDELNGTAAKRRAAISKAQGKTEEAIRILSEYLQVFQSDREAWQELGFLNLSICDYGAASYCFEEVILFEPGNPSHHLACGESKFTENSPRSLLDARKYFSQSLVLKSVDKGNIRAALCLALDTHTIHNRADKVSKVLLDDEDAEEVEQLNRKLNTFACKQIAAVGNVIPDLKVLLEKVVDSLQISNA